MVVRQSYSPETAAVNPGNSVVTRQPFIQERVVCIEEIGDAAILTYRAAHEHFSLALKTLQQTFVVIRILFRIHDDFPDASQIQPLSSEVVYERVEGAWVGQHTPDFFFQCLRIRELSPLGQIQKPFIRNTAPQEERQSRGSFKIAQAVDAFTLLGISIHAQKEVRIDEESFKSELNPGIKASAILATLGEETRQRLDIVFRNRPPIGHPRDSR